MRKAGRVYEFSLTCADVCGRMLTYAAYGHMGRVPVTVTKNFRSVDGKEKTMEVELFTWEKLDYVEKVKAAFNL